jgi:uncharacterized RDD family membrane protein YckC
MAADGRLTPNTMVYDPIIGTTSPAADMFVGEDVVFAAPSKPEAPQPAAPAPVLAPVATAPSPDPVAAPIAVSPAAPPAPVQAYAPAPLPGPSPQNSYPTIATLTEADLGTRFLGLLIDGLIAIPLMIMAVIPVVGIVGAPLLTLYMLLRDYFFGGQSIGKKVMKERVVRVDGSPFTVGHSVLRNIVYAPMLLYMIPFIGMPISAPLMSLLGIAEIICVCTTKRRIGDFLAETQVVRAMD